MNVGTALTSAAHGSVVLNLYDVHTVVLAHFLIPGDRLTPRRLSGALVAYGGIVLLFAGDRASAGASLVGDVLVFVSALLLAERQIYLARAVQQLDPVKLLLAQATVGAAAFLTQPIFGVLLAALVAGDPLSPQLPRRLPGRGARARAEPIATSACTRRRLRTPLEQSRYNPGDADAARHDARGGAESARGS
jgi:drug/metabolite transporter (DMT)-like permease